MRALGLVLLSGAFLTRNAAGQTNSFWDNFPRIVQFENQMCGARAAAKSDGSWVKDARDPALTKRFLNHWNWERFDGNGEIRWAGHPLDFRDDL